MLKPKRSVILEDRGGIGATYYVLQTINTVDTEVDTFLSKSEVERLIQNGVQVTVKAPRGK
jgi:hypothetical protein